MELKQMTRELQTRVRDLKNREWVISGTVYKNKYRDTVIDVETCECIIKTPKRSKWVTVPRKKVDNYFGDIEATLITGDA
jgi:hypothetical protein